MTRRPTAAQVQAAADTVFDLSCVVMVIAALGFIWTLGGVIFAQAFVSALLVGFVAVRGAQAAQAARPRSVQQVARLDDDEVRSDTVSAPVPPTPEQL